MWEIVEIKAKKIGVVKTERRREKEAKREGAK